MGGKRKFSVVLMIIKSLETCFDICIAKSIKFAFYFITLFEPVQKNQNRHDPWKHNKKENRRLQLSKLKDC